MGKFKKSILQNLKGIILVIIAALFVAFGQYFWKIGIENNFYLIIIGCAFYSFSFTLLNISYKYGSLSILQPLLCISNIFAIFIGFFLLNENFSLQKILGVFIIILGVLFIAGGD